MTRRGIEYDLEKSPYICEVYGYTFHFSSKFYVEKFTVKLPEVEAMLSRFILSKFGLHVEPDGAAALLAYRRVETRGFLVSWQGNRYKSPEELRGKISLLPSK